MHLLPFSITILSTFLRDSGIFSRRRCFGNNPHSLYLVLLLAEGGDQWVFLIASSYRRAFLPSEPESSAKWHVDTDTQTGGLHIK